MVTLRLRMGLVALLALGAAFLSHTAGAEAGGVDWPQFRGPERNGVSPEKGLLGSWPESGPRVLWRHPIGQGFSGVATSGERLYTMASDREHETVVCLAADSGKELWRAALGPTFVEEYGNGPRSTPVVDGERVYAVSARGKLVALQAADGVKVWEVDLPATFGTPQPRRGFSPSPLVDGDLVLLEVGGGPGKSVAAFDRRTGATRWTALDGEPGYTSPLVVTIGGVRQYVFVPTMKPEIVSLLPDGKVHWRHAWSPGTLASPLFLPPNRVFASVAEDVGSVMIEIQEAAGKAAVREVWKSRTLKNHFSSSVAVGGFVYGFDNATLKCLDAATGEQKWAHRGFGKGSLIAADGLLIILSDRGALALAEATPQGYREKGRFQAMAGTSWTSPSLARGRLYLRDQDEILALDLQAAGAASTGAP